MESLPGLGPVGVTRGCSDPKRRRPNRWPDGSGAGDSRRPEATHAHTFPALRLVLGGAYCFFKSLGKERRFPSRAEQGLTLMHCRASVLSPGL